MLKLIEDLKYALRMYAKAAGFSVVALLTLSLAIGASTAVFSAVNTVLFKPLPYRDVKKIVMPWRLASKDANLGYNEIPWGDVPFQHLLKLKSFESAGAFKARSFNLTGTDEPVQLDGLKVSAGFFSTLGVAPHLGRVFTEKEDRPGNEQEVILSYAVWQQHFHGDSSVLGRGITLNGLPYSVVGVMPRGFTFPHAEEMPASFDFPHEVQLWIPLALPLTEESSEADELAVVARLTPLASIAQAQAEMNLFASQMDRQFPAAKGWFESQVTGLTAQVTGNSREPLLLTLAAAGTLLLIACANVANLLLARSLGRSSEFALRAALGAGRPRIIRQLLTESILLSLTGGVAGLLLAEICIYLLRAFGPADIPRIHEITLDWRALAFAAGISLLSGALFGLAPAIGSLRGHLAKPLRASGRSSGASPVNTRLRNLFLVAQLALALVLVIASGLLVRTFFRLLAVDPGFNAERVLTFEVFVPTTKYRYEYDIVTFYQKALASLRAIPGVEYAGLVKTIPLAGAADGSSIRLPGRPAPRGKQPFANYGITSSDYFSAVGTPLLRGRAFLLSDTASSRPVAIINATMAKTYWPGENPIGKRVGLAAEQFPAMDIVGVVADVKHLSLREESIPEMYIPFTQQPFTSIRVMHIVLRGRAAAESLTSSARNAIHQVDPDMPLAKVTTLRTFIDASLASQRFATWLVGAFGALSLILASVGVYGVVSYSVSQRTREIGIRMALGAERGAVFSMVLSEGARLAAFGLFAGLLTALAVTRLMTNLLFGIQPTDALTFLVVSTLLICVSLLACYVPAQRATRVDPMTALRYE